MWKQMGDVMAGLDPAIDVLKVSMKIVDARATKREDALRALARA
jgi:hypothetical protein